MQELENREMYLEQLVKSFNPKVPAKDIRFDSGPPLDTSDAILLIQRCERGRQARDALRVRRINKRQRQLADRRNKMGTVLTQEMAALRIQACLRGLLARRRVRREADEVRRIPLRCPLP